MRLVGGFPFVKKRRAKPVIEAKLNHSITYKGGKQQPAFLALNNMEDDAAFQKSSFWTYWTAIPGVSATLCLTLAFWNLQDAAIGFPQHLAITYYAYKINEVMTNVAMAGIMLYIFFRRSLLLQVVEFFSHMLRGRDNDAAIPNFPLSMTFPLTVNFASTLTIVIAVLTRDVFSIKATIIVILQNIFFFLLGTMILLLLELVIFLSIHEYNCIITSLHSCLGDTSRDPGLTHQYEYREITSQSLSVFKIRVMHSSDAWAEPIYSARNRDFANPFEIHHRLLEAEERLTQVNKLLHLINKYCGIPVTLIMLISVISSILTFFYLSFLFQLDTHHTVITFSYTIYSLATPMFLCNAPYSLQEKVVPQCLSVMLIKSNISFS